MPSSHAWSAWDGSIVDLAIKEMPMQKCNRHLPQHAEPLSESVVLQSLQGHAAQQEQRRALHSSFLFGGIIRKGLSLAGFGIGTDLPATIFGCPRQMSDSLLGCEHKMRRGECETNSLYMYPKCTYSCVCRDADIEERCQQWAKESPSRCQYDIAMKDLCKKTCNFCTEVLR
mmetsp:Transcript_3151/g.7102  ORF Transcript_3151/g.7102 Transcript_3151/m.7102 type:complete len:172 (-) Transcript_3151:18-533(-)